MFEGQPEPGGMMRYGIPEYRLPRARLDDDIDVIQQMGVEIRCDTRVGRDVTMDELERDYDAVVIGTGLHLGRSTRVPGSDHPRVLRAVDVLRRIWQGETIQAPQRLVVIGGGNVATDLARTMARIQRRQLGKVDVTVTCVESRAEMLADEEEIVEAEQEGIRVFPSRGPKACVIENSQLEALETVRCLSVFDEQGRFHPKYDESDLQRFEADMVAEAIGQAAQLDFLGEALTDQLEWQHGRLKVDREGRTSVPWLWAAGDLVEGPDIIHAVAAGHRVATSIQAFLRERVEVSA